MLYPSKFLLSKEKNKYPGLVKECIELAKEIEAEEDYEDESISTQRISRQKINIKKVKLRIICAIMI